MKGLILVNAYTHSEHELYQPRRLQEELAERGAGVIVTSIGRHLPLDYTKTLYL